MATSENKVELFRPQLGEIISVKTTSPNRATVKFFSLPFPPETYDPLFAIPRKNLEKLDLLQVIKPAVMEFDGVETDDYVVDPITHVVETRYISDRKPGDQYDFQKDVRKRIRIVQRPRDYASAMQTVGTHTINPFTKFEPVVRWALGLVLNDNNS